MAIAVLVVITLVALVMGACAFGSMVNPHEPQ